MSAFFQRRLMVLSAAMLLPAIAHAHDPYEITGTASVLSNRFEIAAVFEYRAARLLTGRGWPTNQVNEAKEFAAMKTDLESAGEQFFHVSTAEKTFHPDFVTAQLGVENHITLTVIYPAVGETPVAISAPGLTALTEEGQYGVGMTVLDMVRKKVLGQHVFSAANPLAQATFGSSTKTIPAKPAEATAKLSQTNKPISTPLLTLPEAKPAQNEPMLWPWFIAAAFGAVLAWRLRGRK